MHRFILPALCLLLPLTAAFIPTLAYSILGLLGTSHKSMTQDAINDLDVEFFGVTYITTTLAKARDQIADANALVDDTDEHNAPSHFDGESFEDGQARLVDLRKKAKAALKAGDATLARQAVGQALHTVQDFYSHTNWIEMGNTDVNRDALGLDASNVIPRPPLDHPTCQNCTAPLGSRSLLLACQDSCKLFSSKALRTALWLISCVRPCPTQDCSENILPSAGLTSGYFSGEGVNYTKPGDHKCSHGGIYDDSAFGVEGINKDSISFDLSPHGPQYHRRAVKVAIEATKEYIRAFKNDPEVTSERLKLLLGLGPSIAFAIDTTSSMENIIAGVRSQAIDILNNKLGTQDEPILYILSQIQDPDTHLIDKFTNPVDFEDAIESLGSSGGGDCAEYSMAAIWNAVEASDEGGSVFAFTDAAAKDYFVASKLAEFARDKRVKVFVYLFPGDCSESAGYDWVAEASGGRVTRLSQTSEAREATELADSVVRSDSVDIMSVDVSSSSALKRRSGTASYTVPVDSGMTQLSFSLSGIGARFNLRRPDGSKVSANDTGVKLISLSWGPATFSRQTYNWNMDCRCRWQLKLLLLRNRCQSPALVELPVRGDSRSTRSLGVVSNARHTFERIERYSPGID